jgi:orotate phosphoribosyltransferase
VMMHPIGSRIVAEIMHEFMVKQNIDYVTGLELGAVPIVSAITSYFKDVNTKRFLGSFIRKQPKDHGTGNQIEGFPPPLGIPALIVDDVSTTGASILKPLEFLPLRHIKHAFTILDREEGAVEACAEKGITLHSILKKSHFHV